ncbi:MAG TPA: hypothetical protein VL198_13865 [Pseudolabrys sp.]|jgi:hypothetical protein|nr:hypothetical protein [Pseudolabrys sp.]
MLTHSLLRSFSAAITVAGVWIAIPNFGRAQDILKELEENEHGQNHAGHGKEHVTTPDKKKKAGAQEHAGHGGHKQHKKEHSGHKQAKDHGGHGQTETHDGAHGGTPHGTEHQMRGFLGPYPIQREGSGTSWLPDATPHFGVHATYGDWQTMYHALFNLVYDHQGGPRGGDKTFVNGMFMAMAQRPLGEGTFGLRAMLSPDPFMGANGYPLLLATGETADGRTHLIDRQHPHDLFMELATTYSYDFTKNSSVYVYAGLPGEPALGPSAFMHRTSGMDIPEAPITHHWLDSTHITFGVVTAGLVLNTWKIEASAFKGREPDQYRYDIEAPKLDSYSFRVSWNPIRELSFQASWGHLHSPEGLEPDRNEDRFTVSAIYTQPFGKDNIWSTTAAWGRKMLKPGDTLDGLILETAAIFQKTYTVFARAERVQENELVHLPSVPVYTVNKLSVGGIYDFYRTKNAKFGVGGLVSFYGLPADLKPFYGDPTSAMAFVRLKIE